MLKYRAIAALNWSGADVIVRQSLQFITTVALARILTPGEFGTVALLSLITALAAALADGGFSTAIIQRQDLTHIDESTAFWMNLGLGTLASLCLVASAPMVALFFDMPILAPMTAMMALSIFFGALGSVHGALLTKRLDFKTQMLAGLMAAIVSGGLAIALAMGQFGVWSLVAQSIAGSAVYTIFLWALNPWRPTGKFSVESARRLFDFSGYLLASTLTDLAYSRLYTVLIGKLHGVADLGYYGRAESTRQLPTGILTSILGRITLPLFSASTADPQQLKRSIHISLQGLMLLNAPLMLGLAAVSDPLIIGVFGEEWKPAVSMLQVLCLAGLLWPAHVININVMMALGRTKLMFKLEVLKKTIGLVLLGVGVAYGPIGVAWSQVAFSILAFFINARVVGRITGYGAPQQLGGALPALAMSGAMACLLHLGSQILHATPLRELFALTALGALVYILACVITKPTALRDVLRVAFPTRNEAPSL